MQLFYGLIECTLPQWFGACKWKGVLRVYCMYTLTVELAARAVWHSEKLRWHIACTFVFRWGCYSHWPCPQSRLDRRPLSPHTSLDTVCSSLTVWSEEISCHSSIAFCIVSNTNWSPLSRNRMIFLVFKLMYINNIWVLWWKVYVLYVFVFWCTPPAACLLCCCNNGAQYQTAPDGGWLSTGLFTLCHC